MVAKGKLRDGMQCLVDMKEWTYHNSSDIFKVSANVIFTCPKNYLAGSEKYMHITYAYNYRLALCNVVTND